MSSSLTIQMLPTHLANQIAAGEVVQRPESVVKELVENAIDAQATHVTIIIAGAGKSLIQVVDDGIGMSEEDALLSFQRHATSKIRTLQDLEAIITLGFRGEALPSIASVAKVEMRTRREGEELAVAIRIEGGAVEEQTRVEGPRGTSIAVKNLFFNTPARRQFLKSDSTEFRHISDTVQRYILSYPDLHITFIADGDTVVDAPPGTLARRAELLFGERASAGLIELREETEILTVSGFVGLPEHSKKTRGDQYLFVNGRFVVSRYLNHAITSAYENFMAQGEYPLYVIFLNIDPHHVDVNVHPSKLEVKFSNERNIYTILHAVVRNGLFKRDLAPSVTFAPPSDAFPGIAKTRPPSVDTSEMRGGPMRDLPPQRPTPPPGRSTGMDMGQVDALFRAIGFDVPPPAPSDIPPPGPADIPPPRGGEDAAVGEETILLPSGRPVSAQQFLWQLHNKYIFTPIKSGLMIIDQHVAHERILYERAMSAFEHSAPFSQQLLFPHEFTVSPGDHEVLQELREDLHHLGFVLDLSRKGRVIVDAVPQDVRVGMEESILEELLQEYMDRGRTDASDHRHRLAASYACRTAIKSGDSLSAPEMQALIDHLFETSNPYVCPHGRPIIIKLSLQELDHRFGRSS